MSELRNGDPVVAQGKVISGDASVLCAHDEADGVSIMCFGIVQIALFRSTYDAEAALLQILYGDGEVCLTADGQCVERSG